MSMRDGPRLPAGYRLDEVTEPGLPILRRPDGSVVGVFSAWGATAEAIGRAAREDHEAVRRPPEDGDDEGPEAG